MKIVRIRLKMFSTFILCALLFIVVSCVVTSHDYNMELSCNDFAENNHNHTDFELEVGDKIRLRLCSNPTTGFQWDYDMTVENVVTEEDHDLKEPEVDIPGAPGVEVWTFEAVGEGTTELRMEYSQPWEGGLKSEWTYTMAVTVE